MCNHQNSQSTHINGWGHSSCVMYDTSSFSETYNQKLITTQRTQFNSHKKKKKNTHMPFFIFSKGNFYIHSLDSTYVKGLLWQYVNLHNYIYLCPVISQFLYYCLYLYTVVTNLFILPKSRCTAVQHTH